MDADHQRVYEHQVSASQSLNAVAVWLGIWLSFPPPTFCVWAVPKTGSGAARC
jgi:hypothetical protein